MDKKMISRRRERIRMAAAAAFCLAAALCSPPVLLAAEVPAAEVPAAGIQTAEAPALIPGWQQQNDRWYYFDASGAPAEGWRDIDGKYYFFRDDGGMASGSMQEGDTLYTFTPEQGSLAYARKGKNTGGGSFAIGFYNKERQELADNLNELKEDAFDGDEEDDYYEDDKVDYDAAAGFLISGRLTEIAEHRLSMARSKGYGSGNIPGEGSLADYVKAVRYQSGRRFLEVYLKDCDDADDAENKLLRSHGSGEKKRSDRAIYYKEMGIAHENVNGKHYYMVIFMR